MKAITPLVLLALFSATASATVNIEMVTIENPGNAPDLRYNIDRRPEGYGAVDYVYQIGKYEVTAGQYTEFLNAVAKIDTYDLYSPLMGSILNHGANIKRTGSSPNYSYSVADDWANRPVNYVSFWDAARFANWLHNGQPTGTQGPGTTEDGAYHDVGNQTLFGRNAGAKFFIPTEDEWYKAAYHNKAAGLVASYFDYPTGTNVVSGNDLTETTNPGNNGNYSSSGIGIGHPYYRTLVGEFELSDSPYGTFDQGGNVLEWDEAAVSSLIRGLPGGAFTSSPGTVNAGHHPQLPTEHLSDTGFRVAGIIPEPTTGALLAAALMNFFIIRRRNVMTTFLSESTSSESGSERLSSGTKVPDSIETSQNRIRNT